MTDGEKGITDNMEKVIQVTVGLCLISFLFFQVDSAKPFGEDISEHYSQKSRRKSKFPNFPFPVRRGTQVSCYPCIFLYGGKCILLLNLLSFCGMFSLETWSLILKYSPAVEFPGKEFLWSRASREAV